jgi:ABC-type bacteriocin/lantibiotic exporter with double-glycine peptidase domain
MVDYRLEREKLRAFQKLDNILKISLKNGQNLSIPAIINDLTGHFMVSDLAIKKRIDRHVFADSRLKIDEESRIIVVSSEGSGKNE